MLTVFRTAGKPRWQHCRIMSEASSPVSTFFSSFETPVTPEFKFVGWWGFYTWNNRVFFKSQNLTVDRFSLGNHRVNRSRLILVIVFHIFITTSFRYLHYFVFPPIIPDGVNNPDNYLSIILIVLFNITVESICRLKSHVITTPCCHLWFHGDTRGNYQSSFSK